MCPGLRMLCSHESCVMWTAGGWLGGWVGGSHELCGHESHVLMAHALLTFSVRLNITAGTRLQVQGSGEGEEGWVVGVTGLN